MFQTTKTPILGMIQNMSLFVCPHCQQGTHIFGSGEGHGLGVQRSCEKYEIEFLGDVPLHEKICEDADRGKPTIVSEPESDRARAYESIMEKIGGKIGLF